MFAILDALYLDMWIRRLASVENAMFGSILRTIQNILKYRPFPTAEDGRVVPPISIHTDAEFEALERGLAKVRRECESLKATVLRPGDLRKRSCGVSCIRKRPAMRS